MAVVLVNPMDAPSFVDHYAVLGVPSTATEDAIRKKYRQQSLLLHPDKNQDRVDIAAKEFDRLKKSYDVLINAGSRASFDVTRTEKVESFKRHQDLQNSRKRMREDLLEREKEVLKREKRVSHVSKIDMLRMENEERMGVLSKACRDNRTTENAVSPTSTMTTDAGAGGHRHGPSCTREKCREKVIIVKWDRKKVSHTESSLRKIFEAAGAVEIVRIGSKQKSAIVQFATTASPAFAALAVTHDLKIVSKDLEKQESAPGSSPCVTKALHPKPSIESIVEPKGVGMNAVSPAPTSKSPSGPTFSSFETLVLERLKKAAESQRDQVS